MTVRADYRTVSTQSAAGIPWSTCLHNIDHKVQPHYIEQMNEKTETSMIEQEILHLEQQVENLLTTIKRLRKENQSLRTQQDLMATERAALLEKHDSVRGRVEGIVTRLKSLETGT